MTTAGTYAELFTLQAAAYTGPSRADGRQDHPHQPMPQRHENAKL